MSVSESVCDRGVTGNGRNPARCIALSNLRVAPRCRLGNFRFADNPLGAIPIHGTRFLDCQRGTIDEKSARWFEHLLPEPLSAGATLSVSGLIPGIEE